jgi:hypothetical protein
MALFTPREAVRLERRFAVHVYDGAASLPVVAALLGPAFGNVPRSLRDLLVVRAQERESTLYQQVRCLRVIVGEAAVGE